MTDRLRHLLSELQPDRWRLENPFSQEIDEVQRAIWSNSAGDLEVATSINNWLAKYQPCVFGRVAARLGSIDYCILRESHLQDSDEAVFGRIQEYRARWKTRAHAGQSSGFVLVILSETIAKASPSESVLQLATELCRMYLVADEVRADEIYVDQLELGVPTTGAPLAAITFDVGINYFNSQADGRWWADHRIPGGLAFSLNSVGHFVRSGIAAKASKDFEQVVFGNTTDSPAPKLDSLGEALRWAMQTISNASESVSGKATSLLPIGGSPSSESRPACPIELPKGLAGFEYCYYQGWYHTDFTLPSEYFRPDISRPPELPPRQLDFTYLFDARLDNPAFFRMGQGVRARRLESAEDGSEATNRLASAKKRRRAIPQPRSITRDPTQ